MSLRGIASGLPAPHWKTMERPFGQWGNGSEPMETPVTGPRAFPLMCARAHSVTSRPTGADAAASALGGTGQSGKEATFVEGT